MSHYQGLLAKAVTAVTGKAEEKGVESLFQRGGTVLTNDSFRGIDDFEVIAYLVILGEPARGGMIERLYDAMAIPAGCKLGKRVFKKLFEENADLGIADRKALRDDLDSVTWAYTLEAEHHPNPALRGRGARVSGDCLAPGGPEGFQARRPARRDHPSGDPVPDHPGLRPPGSSRDQPGTQAVQSGGEGCHRCRRLPGHGLDRPG